MKHVKIFEEFVNEAMGFKQLKTMLDTIAAESRIPLRETKKTPIKTFGYDGGTMYNYMLGNVEVVVKNIKSPGAPRFNSVEVFILTEPGADKGKQFTNYDDFGGFTEALKKKLEETKGSSTSTSVPAKQWSRPEIEKLTIDLKKRDEPVEDDQLFDIVQGVFSEYPGLEDSIRKVYAVQDPVGWFVNKIA